MSIQTFGAGLITERVRVASRFGGSIVLALFLLLGPSSVQAGDCGPLCDEEFWKSATPAAVKTLLDAGADLTARTNLGYTPLHLATAFNENPAVVMALLEAGANLKARTKGDIAGGKAPLHVAVLMNENPAVIRALLEAGANPNTRDGDGYTPLGTAVSAKNPVAVRVLLDAGANPNVRNGSGWTSLHSAVFDENPVVAIVRVLLDAGADPNAREGMTGGLLLHSEAVFKNPEVLIALLDAGADPKAKDMFGRTVFDVIEEEYDELKGTDLYWRLHDLQYE